MTDIVEQAARVLAENWQNMHTNESLGKQQMLAQALADAGLLREPVTTILEEFVVPCPKCNPDDGRCIPCRGEADTYYRAAINAISTYSAAKELARDGDSDAGGYVGRDLRELAEHIKQHLLEHPEPPARTVPTREEIAEAILMVTQAENIDPAYAWDFQFLEVQDELLAQADSVLALMADQPTVEEVKAQALEEAAENINLHKHIPEDDDRITWDMCLDDDCIWWEMAYALQDEIKARAQQIRDGSHGSPTVETRPQPTELRIEWKPKPRVESQDIPIEVRQKCHHCGTWATTGTITRNNPVHIPEAQPNCGCQQIRDGK